MSAITLLGFVAGGLTTLSFIPQVLKTWRSRRCDDLSWALLLSFASGVLLWIVYGALVREAPVVVANAVTLALISMIVSMKLRFAGKSE